MKELLEKVRSNFLNTLTLEYDVNSAAKKLSKDVNITVNDGMLEEGYKFSFIEDIIKEVLNGKTLDDGSIKTGRFELILKRINEKIDEFSTAERNEENIKAFINDTDVVFSTMEKILLIQDKDLIKKRIIDSSLEKLTDEEANKVRNMLLKYSKFDEDYNDFVNNKITDIKNSISFTINMNNK